MLPVYEKHSKDVISHSDNRRGSLLLDRSERWKRRGSWSVLALFWCVEGSVRRECSTGHPKIRLWVEVAVPQGHLTKKDVKAENSRLHV
jgi:hypothetical protein